MRKLRLNCHWHKKDRFPQTKAKLVFDIVGVDLSIINSLRRILLSEIPTVAIETVFLENNTSVIPDEVLAHRLGLIPLNIDPSLLVVKNPEDLDNADNTVVFSINVKCEKNPQISDPGLDPKLRYINHAVYSNSIVWTPKDKREQSKHLLKKPAPCFDNILVAKLVAGQEIKAKLHANKNIGKSHAKFSPVATAFYRLLPIITLNKEITGSAAIALENACPMKVFDIEDSLGSSSSSSSSSSSVSSHSKLVVARPRNCSVCRECIRNAWVEEMDDEEDEVEGKSGGSGNSSGGMEKEGDEKKKWKGKKKEKEKNKDKEEEAEDDDRYLESLKEKYKDAVTLSRALDYCIFSIESVGQLPAALLMNTAMDVLTEKLDRLMLSLDEAERG